MNIERIGKDFTFALRFGNWIFVNFPVETEILSNLSEKNVQADDVIVVQDNSSQLEILQKRWYKTNRFEIDREIRERKDQEANEQRLRDDEEKFDRKEKISFNYRFVVFFRRRVEQLKLQAEQERQERLAERQRKIEAGEAVDEEDEDAESGSIDKNRQKIFNEPNSVFRR